MFDLTDGGRKVGLQRHATKLLRCAVGGNRRREEKAKTQKGNLMKLAALAYYTIRMQLNWMR